jgi:predicted YcjX-like family ATPase
VKLSTLASDARQALIDIADRAGGVVSPNVRLGVTGLSRAGKTVFITALVHNLLQGGRLPLFKAYASGRITGASMAPQPDDAVPRFDYERHVADLVDARRWPDSTRHISELRVTIAYESASFWQSRLGRGELHLDLIDYPGEWLLDLPLLAKDFSTWSAEAIISARKPERAAMAKHWVERMALADPAAPADEAVARELAARFTSYLRACRGNDVALATMPPGRFLMPGDLAGSPALTFAPLAGAGGSGSLWQMMARRYEAYKSVVVKPFFRDHFSRLDRQIILVDALAALNSGPHALAELENALAEILAAFRVGSGGFLASLMSRRIDRILVAATKADQLHHEDHDRLEAILRRIMDRAIRHASFSGAGVEVLAMAAVRSTREAQVLDKQGELPAVVGVPLAGESLGGRIFDGSAEAAVFPGDLPGDPTLLFEPSAPSIPPLRFVHFRPPPLERTAEGLRLSLPHIRLDRALEYLIGDKLT